MTLKCFYWKKTKKNYFNFIEDSLYVVNTNGELKEFIHKRDLKCI